MGKHRRPIVWLHRHRVGLPSGGRQLRFNLKIAAAGLGLAMAIQAAPAQAFTLLTGWSGGPVYGDPWTPSLNTPSTSPLRWQATDAVDNVWFRVYFNGRIDDSGSTLNGLAASITFQLTEVTNGGKDWKFEYDVFNASNNDFLNGVQNVVTQANIRSFSFDVFPSDNDPSATPRLTGATLVGLNDYDSLIRNKSMNAGADLTSNKQDICIKSGQTNNCHGGGNIGPKIGDTWSGAFVLNFNAAPDFVSFTDPMVRFNAIQINGSGDYSGTGVPYAWVPEPGAWALMILGFGAAGAMLRRRRVAAAA